MPLTTEQRIELLKKARAAKAAKKAEVDSLKPTPVKGRPKKETKTLDLTPEKPDMEFGDEEVEELQIEPSKQEVDEIKKIKNMGNPKKSQKAVVDEPEIVEEVEVKKIKKPKKRIVRKIIKEEYDSESTEEEYEEIVYSAPKHRSKAKPKPVEKPIPSSDMPKESNSVEPKKSGINLFSY